jgi:hypothetical protein
VVRSRSDAVTKAPPIVREVIDDPGRHLDEATRSRMEARFEHDFSGVRVHTDPKAAASADAIRATAYAVGEHVVFADGQYAPATSRGDRTLTHELAHVAQQRDARVPTSLDIGAPNGAREREADRAVNATTTGGRASTGAQGGPATVQRTEDTQRLPEVPRLELTPPTFPIPPSRPRLPVPRLQLGGHDTLVEQLSRLHGVTALSPRGIRLKPSLGSAPTPHPALPPGAAQPTGGVEPAETVDKVWELEFDLDVDPSSPLGRTLSRHGLPLQAAGGAEVERTRHILTLLSGSDVDETPLGLRLANLGVNLLATVRPIAEARDRLHRALHIDTIAVVVDPSSGTYGLKLDVKLP